ncbi:MAG: hypothetical protein JHC81_08935 [Brevundimonas sp.]|uniref:hypothetical protein n=1 Tax=Brevundimonas sp. TaxID=1871086 RepID=UPI001A2ADC28|nr:hypothetical protein [Brevundimonas sp.]MBJ7447647.1 hypothetical protein [Brevundimonas sp.]
MRSTAFTLGMLSLFASVIAVLAGLAIAYENGDGLLFFAGAAVGLGLGLIGSIVLMLVRIDERLEETAKQQAKDRAATAQREAEGSF